jgi:predicted MPP superfamily phosphohydrolase
LWTGLVNRIHATGIAHWVIASVTPVCFFIMAAIALACGWWFVNDYARLYGQLIGGTLVRSLPDWAMLYLAVCWISAAIVVPSWLWRHVLHRPPAVVRYHRRRNLMRRAPPPETAEQPHHFVVRVPGNQSLSLDLTERAIDVPRLPQALDGLSLVHLSDLHFTGRIGKHYFQEMVRLSNELQPDIVVLTGDLVDRVRCIDWIPDTLGRLTARHGVYCILGNHDVRTDPGRLIDVLEQSGLCYLGGRYVRIEIRGVPVVLAGNELPWLTPAADIERCLPPCKGGPFRIVLAHSPDQLDWAQTHDADLLLVGHMHGGQIRLPLIGPIMAPSRLGVKYASGVFHAPPTIMHVTRGISGELPLRFNCAPEIAHLVLHAPKKDG